MTRSDLIAELHRRIASNAETQDRLRAAPAWTPRNRSGMSNDRRRMLMESLRGQQLQLESLMRWASETAPD